MSKCGSMIIGPYLAREQSHILARRRGSLVRYQNPPVNIFALLSIMLPVVLDIFTLF